MGEAFKVANQDFDKDHAHISALRKRLIDGILADTEEVYFNGTPDQSVPGIVNISFNYVEGESLLMALKDIAVSSGSACTSASLEPSYVLRALGRNDELAHSSIRFSIGRFTTEEEIDYTVQLIKDSIGRLREMSPLWEMFKDGVDLESVEWTHH
jgi:cysteine desulfurase